MTPIRIAIAAAVLAFTDGLSPGKITNAPAIAAAAVMAETIFSIVAPYPGPRSGNTCSSLACTLGDRRRERL